MNENRLIQNIRDNYRDDKNIDIVGYCFRLEDIIKLIYIHSESNIKKYIEKLIKE
jgi:hypothetical protein